MRELLNGRYDVVSPSGKQLVFDNILILSVPSEGTSMMVLPDNRIKFIDIHYQRFKFFPVAQEASKP